MSGQKTIPTMNIYGLTSNRWFKNIWGKIEFNQGG